MRLTIPKKLLILIAVSALVSTAAIGVQLLSLKERIRADREQMLVSQVDTATTIAKGFAEQAQKGEISEAEAKRLAASAIRSIRYGKGDYFFVMQEDGLMVVHPKPEREGQSSWDDTDANGFHQSRALIASAKDGGGFTSYVWPRLGEDVPSPKLAYSNLFAPWGWVIATGVYVDDLQVVFMHELYKSLAWLAGILLVLAACAWPIARSISRPLGRVNAVMRELAEGHNGVEVPYVGRRDEIGEMADAVQSFKEAALAKERLEAEGEDIRRQQQAQRDRQAAQDQEQTEALEDFVGEIRRGFERLSQGDLTVRLERPVASQYEAIRQQFNSSVSSLEETVGSVVGAINSIRSGLGEITSASNNLSQRTEQQAASLEETVAALGQVTGAVNETAQGAGEAQQAAETAKVNAAKGGDIVGQAIEAMSGIEESSKQISQIIGVIDEIAFQTNLLALNAGVEAARAGEAGKGFAVVAQEVRALAQRSAEAAKEIKELISRSNGQVQTGVELVSASGTSLSEIVEQVGRMSRLVSEIAAKAKDQAESLREVSIAADEMDKVTQQNAAMVEETTAASESLARETDGLARSIERFKVSGSERTAARPAAPAAPAAKRPAAARPAPRPVAQAKPASRGNLALAASSAPEEEGWEEF